MVAPVTIITDIGHPSGDLWFSNCDPKLAFSETNYILAELYLFQSFPENLANDVFL